MFVKLSPQECADLGRVAFVVGVSPLAPETDQSAFVRLAAAEARQWRDHVARVLIGVTDPDTTARLAKLDSELVSYAACAERVERRAVEVAA